MKKRFSILFLFIFSYISLPFNALASSSTDPFVQVNSEITYFNDAEFKVKTKGELPNEGFSFSFSKIDPGKPVGFFVDLKGKDKVILKIYEHDVNGEFIREEKTGIITLNNKWKLAGLTIDLKENTRNIDVMVLTSDKNQAEFFVKEPTIVK
jgi:hypothetical protein